MKTKNNKILKNYSFYLILFWLIITTIKFVFNIEFSSRDNELEYNKLRVVLVTISAIFITYNLSNGKPYKKSIKATIASLLSILIITFQMFENIMCSYDENIIYKNKYDNRKFIISRSLNCGAYDNDFPSDDYFIVTKLNSYLQQSKKTDIELLDKKQWIKQ